jgi:polyisoprenoid-binding protein YceI
MNSSLSLTAKAIGLATFGALTTMACDNNPAKGKAQATASSALTVPVAAVGAQTGTYAFSASSSKVGFVGAKVTGKHEGTFGTFSGTIRLVDGNPEKSSVSVDIDMASLSAEPAKLTTHLKSADLFDVAKFPKAKFTTTSIKALNSSANYTLTGNLEMHGVTKSISFPATIRTSAAAVEADAEFAINRKDFGVIYPGMPDDLIKDEILLKLEIRSKSAP